MFNNTTNCYVYFIQLQLNSTLHEQFPHIKKVNTGRTYDRSSPKTGSYQSWLRTLPTHKNYAVGPLCIRRRAKPPYPRPKLFENGRTHVLESLAYTPPARKSSVGSTAEGRSLLASDGQSAVPHRQSVSGWRCGRWCLAAPSRAGCGETKTV